MDTEVYFESFAGACLPSAGLGSFLSWTIVKIQQLSWLLVCQDILHDVVNQRKFWSNLLSNTFSQTAEPQTGSLQEVSITLNLCQNWYEPIYPRVSYKRSTAPSFIFRILWRKEMRRYPIKAPFGWLPDCRVNRWCRWWVGNDSVSLPRPSDLLQNERPGLGCLTWVPSLQHVYPCGSVMIVHHRKAKSLNQKNRSVAQLLYNKI